MSETTGMIERFTITFDVPEADALREAHAAAVDAAFAKEKAAGRNIVTDLRLETIERDPQRPGILHLTASYSAPAAAQAS